MVALTCPGAQADTRRAVSRLETFGGLPWLHRFLGTLVLRRRWRVLSRRRFDEEMVTRVDLEAAGFEAGGFDLGDAAGAYRSSRGCVSIGST